MANRSTRGRKFATWRFHLDGSRTVELDCTVDDDVRRGVSYSDPTFSVVSREYAIDLKDGNAKKLRERVAEELIQKATLDWQYWLLVKMRPERDDYLGSPFEDGGACRPLWSEAKRLFDDVDVSTGFVLRVELYRSAVVEMPDWSKRKDPTIWEQYSRGGSWRREHTSPREDRDGSLNEDDNSSALLPLTETNAAALSEMVRAIEKLKQRIAVIMRPEKIEATIRSVLANGAPLAIAGPTEPSRKSSDGRRKGV